MPQKPNIPLLYDISNTHWPKFLYKNHHVKIDRYSSIYKRIRPGIFPERQSREREDRQLPSQKCERSIKIPNLRIVPNVWYPYTSLYSRNFLKFLASNNNSLAANSPCSSYCSRKNVMAAYHLIFTLKYFLKLTKTKVTSSSFTSPSNSERLKLAPKFQVNQVNQDWEHKSNIAILDKKSDSPEHFSKDER